MQELLEVIYPRYVLYMQELLDVIYPKYVLYMQELLETMSLINVLQRVLQRN